MFFGALQPVSQGVQVQSGVPGRYTYLPRSLGPAAARAAGGAAPMFFGALQPVTQGVTPPFVPIVPVVPPDIGILTGEVFSGGWLRDSDGRRVVTVDQAAGTKVYSGGQVRDGDGRTVVVIEGD